MNRLIDPAAKTVEAHGYCAYTDADNDQIFEKCDFLPGKPNTCELTGGTGKFEGLQGSIIITSAPVKSTYEGTQQLVGHKNGTYKIVKTNLARSIRPNGHELLGAESAPSSFFRPAPE